METGEYLGVEYIIRLCRVETYLSYALIIVSRI